MKQKIVGKRYISREMPFKAETLALMRFVELQGNRGPWSWI
jgi:hypothetical protein